MRVLLAAADDPREVRMQGMLESMGHEVIREAAKSEELLASIEAAGQLHAAVLGQGSLGRRWPRLLRQLRKRAPSLPVVILLGLKADRTWRLAMLAGAFEAVPADTPVEDAVRAVRRALAYTVGRVVGELSVEGVSPGKDQSGAQAAAQEVATPSRSR